jgi:alpha-L-fucosidase 2
MFTETYGIEPFEQRTDKLQASGWHKWEWVSGLELVSLLLDRHEYTGDGVFLRDTALPAAREVLGFFDQHYRTGEDGKLHMHPAQALETWWDCVNPMPELAGLHAATARLLALPEALTTGDERAFWKQLQAKLPALPTTRTPDGKTMLAPAREFTMKRNSENPELYAVFPFRQIAVGRPNLEWGIEALNHRTDKGAFGWRQDDLFMAYLGLADQARDYTVRRARLKNAASRFPVFWGPNYDWVPDQDHGSVLLATVQALLLQTDGRRIYLLPAWPRDWNCDFKLHAPYQTVIEGKVVEGKLVDVKVTPPSRAQDVVVMRAETGH